MKGLFAFLNPGSILSRCQHFVHSSVVYTPNRSTMKKNLFIFGALALAIIGSAFISGDPEMESLELGTKAPMQDYKMEDFMGKGHSLKTLAK